MSNITYDQLRVFVAVAEQGGVNAAATRLFRSPSTISHALRKLQERLQLNLFEPEGRGLQLTAAGQGLLKQSRRVLEESRALESMAEHLRENRRAEIALAVDAICPQEGILEALARFAKDYPQCQVKLYEDVLSGAEERLVDGIADICIAYRVPPGYLGEKYMDIPFVPVVAARHPLAGKRDIGSRELMNQRQVVISDSGTREEVDSGWLKAAERWTVSSMATATKVVLSGLAFGWIPAHLVRHELESGQLVQLSLASGGDKTESLYLTVEDEHCTMSHALASLLKQGMQAGAC